MSTRPRRLYGQPGERTRTSEWDVAFRRTTPTRRFSCQTLCAADRPRSPTNRLTPPSMLTTSPHRRRRRTRAGHPLITRHTSPTPHEQPCLSPDSPLENWPSRNTDRASPEEALVTDCKGEARATQLRAHLIDGTSTSAVQPPAFACIWRPESCLDGNSSLLWTDCRSS
jgi:hypothetical protein